MAATRTYSTTLGRALRQRPVTLHASAAMTATGSGTGVELGDSGTLILTLDVTAASGTTPSMTVSVETSEDNSTWRTLGSFTAKTAAGAERKSFPGVDQYARATWTITGTTPSFTFTVTGDAK